MKIIGLTGGIASGKSTVSRMFQSLGAVTRSADEDARAVLAPGSPLLAAVLAAFPGARRPDGTLDRAKLGAHIFTDPAARTRLEALLHPAIIARMTEAIAAARNAGPGVLVYETPLLFEAGLAPLFDTVIATLATPTLQRDRLQERERAAGRPPLTASGLAKRLAAQLPSDKKAHRAAHIVRTDLPLTETEAQVRRLWESMGH